MSFAPALVKVPPPGQYPQSMAKDRASSLVKWLMVLLVAAAAAGVGFWYWKEPREKAPDYKLAVVMRGELTQTVTANGQLNPVVNVQVGSQISGIIQNLFADFNSSVTQVQLVAELDPATYEATVHQNEG